MSKENFNALLEALKAMTHNSIDQDEQGGCVYCGGIAVGNNLWSNTSDSSHMMDCEWLIGRKVVLSIQPDAFDTN